MKKMVKIKIGEEMDFNSDDYTELKIGSIDEAILFFTTAKANGANTIEWSANNYYDGCVDSISSQPIQIREETNEEYTKRIEEEKQTEENQKQFTLARKRQQYEDLKKEFEGK